MIDTFCRDFHGLSFDTSVKFLAFLILAKHHFKARKLFSPVGYSKKSIFGNLIDTTGREFNFLSNDSKIILTGP